MKKLSKRQKIWSILGISIILLFFITEFCLGLIIKSTINNIAPEILGANVKVDDVDVRPFRGKVYIKGFVVGPPEGFKHDIFNLDKFYLDFDFWSLFSDTIIINEVTIENPVVTYELNGIHSNINKLMERFKEETKDTEEETTEEKSDKKVIIKHFKFTGGKVKLAASTFGNSALPIPLPAIELNGIGEKSGGMTAIEATGEIIYSIGKGVIVAAKDIALGAAGAVGDAVGDAADAVGNAASAVGNFVGGLFSEDKDSKDAKEAEK